MAKDFAKAFYKSKAWHKCRAAYIAERVLIDGAVCERCGKDQGYILHHKILLTPSNILDPHVSLNHDNLEFVCKACHDRIHEQEIYGTGPEPRALFSEDGQPVDVRQL